MRWISLIFIWSWVGLLWGQQVKFYADVSQNKVSKGQSFEVRFTLENADYGDWQSPSFEGFEVISGPMLSNSIQIINGARSSKKIWSFELLALQVGKFEIPKARLRTPNGTITTQEITIQVVDAKPVDQDLGDFGLYILLDTTEYFVGEQIEVKYKLLFRPDVTNFEILKEDNYEDLDALTIGTEYSRSKEIIDGIRYHSTIVRRVLLYPSQVGTLTLDPMFARLTVRQERSGSFFYKTTKVNVSSIGREITIRPHPEDIGERPVGRYALEGFLSDDVIDMSDALELMVRLTTDGNPKEIPEPEIVGSDLLEVYEPKLTREQTILYNDEPRHIREYEYAILPRRAGRGEISAEMEFFHPDSGGVVTVSTGSLTFDIQSAGGNPMDAYDDEPEQEWAVSPRDLRVKGLRQKGFFLLEKWWYYLLALLAGIPAVMGLQKRKKDARWNQLSSEEKRRLLAWNKAKSHFEELELAKDRGDGRRFFDQLGQSFEAYLCEKLEIAPAHFSIAHVEEKLSTAELTNSQMSEMKEVFEKSKYYRFAPVSEEIDLGQWYERVKKLVLLVEDKL